MDLEKDTRKEILIPYDEEPRNRRLTFSDLIRTHDKCLFVLITVLIVVIAAILFFFILYAFLK